MPIIDSNIALFSTIFKGREDVFAIHWTKGKKSGYMPAYRYDPYHYRLHKIKGGTFKDYPDKSFLPLSDIEIKKHLNGDHLIGIYPMLKDNTSWFLTADFDKRNWIKESQKFIDVCHDHDISAYLERSRSGQGGHVWIFFDRPVPAIRSRKVVISILQKTGIFSVFDKSSSFDRLFPNQDFLSGKGLGNLIALPYYKPAMEKGNSCFVDQNLEPFPDQWNFLKSVKKVSATQLNDLYESWIKKDGFPLVLINDNPDNLKIRLSNFIFVNRSAMPSHLIEFVKEELNIPNPEYFVKRNIGKNTWNTRRYYRFIEETENEVVIPRGFIGRILRYCKQMNIDHDFQDERMKLKSVNLSANVSLRPHQKPVMDVVAKKDFGVITAPPGSGKTIIGLKIIAEKRQPALIVVHRKLLLEQWIECIQAFLGIPKKEIGRIGQGKMKPGKEITVAMIQSLGKLIEKSRDETLINSFGTVIIDECHHIPAESYWTTISRLKPFYQYGLTATPFRKWTEGKLIFIHLGDIIAEIKEREIANFKCPEIIVRNTSFDIPFNIKTDSFETLSKILIHDSTRNKLILEDIISEMNKGKRAVVITERKEHIGTLHQFLKQSFETITLSGEDSEKMRKSKWKTLRDGKFQILITTGQLFGEGTDLHGISILFLAYPFSFKGKLIQYIGRVQRSETTPTIYDYRDIQIDYLNKLFLSRNAYYRQLDRQISLFEDIEVSEKMDDTNILIDKKIKIPLDQLEFLFGTIAFTYNPSEVNTRLEFEIENDYIRPEFDVLKPYFSKVLGSKNIIIDIYAEFEKHVLIAQGAHSNDIEKINRDVIESVKFQFIKKEVLGHKSSNEGELIDLKKFQQNQDSSGIFKSDNELLDEILKEKNYKHSRHLRFLADKHDSSKLKLRYVLDPFSFVFLLTGKEQYHIVLETLDTEEATYIWHVEKNSESLSEKLSEIDRELSIIRNKGRLSFLQQKSEEFSRIIHDYEDERKGFVLWRDRLEERLI